MQLTVLPPFSMSRASRSTTGTMRVCKHYRQSKRRRELDVSGVEWQHWTLRVTDASGRLLFSLPLGE